MIQGVMNHAPTNGIDGYGTKPFRTLTECVSRCSSPDDLAQHLDGPVNAIFGGV